VRDAGRLAGRFGEFDAALEPVASEVKHLEGPELGLALEQAHDRVCQVRQVSPSVADV
jgi:hypothetical protein